MVAEEWATASTAGFSPTKVTDDFYVHRFVHHPMTNDIFCISRGNSLTHHRSLGTDEENVTLKYQQDSQHVFKNPISAIEALPASRHIIVTTHAGSGLPSVWLYHWSLPSQEPFEQLIRYSLNVDSIWAASALPTFSIEANFVPPTYTEMIGLATGEGLSIFSMCPDGDRHITHKFETSTDVQALCWLSPNMLSFGCRDGRILLYDPRSEGCSHVITHPTAVARILPADDFTRIVCAGINDTLMLYDMRMSKHTSVSPYAHETRRSGKRRKLKNGTYKVNRASTPLLVFPYQNYDYNDLGLDSYPALGLLAGTDAEGSLLVWSLRTGNVLRKFVPEVKGLVGDRERCVRFVENDDESGSLGIWSTFNQGAIWRFGW
jgi:hypothetical protein